MGLDKIAKRDNDTVPGQCSRCSSSQPARAPARLTTAQRRSGLSLGELSNSFIYLMMDSVFVIGYTAVSARRRNHFLTARDGLDATSLTDNRARDRMNPPFLAVWPRR
jgi:hypothetical protein